MSSMGWRQGVRVAIRDKSRCKFYLRDNRNMLASSYALIYGQDHALMRLLSYLEARSGVGMRPKDDRPRPFSLDLA
jgi:hypothetical protein